MLDVEEPSPLSHDNNHSFPSLVVVGHHWSPRREGLEGEELYIDEILEINYE